MSNVLEVQPQNNGKKRVPTILTRNSITYERGLTLSALPPLGNSPLTLAKVQQQMLSIQVSEIEAFKNTEGAGRKADAPKRQPLEGWEIGKRNNFRPRGIELSAVRDIFGGKIRRHDVIIGYDHIAKERNK